MYKWWEVSMHLWNPPREDTPILGHGREVQWWWPPFLRFSIWMGPYFMPHHDPIDSCFLPKKLVCLSHLVPEIFRPKVHLIFHQNVLLNIFSIQLALFFIDLRWFLPLIFTKPYIRLVQKFYRMLNPQPKIWWSTLIFSCLHIHEQTSLTKPDFQKIDFEI